MAMANRPSAGLGKEFIVRSRISLVLALCSGNAVAQVMPTLTGSAPFTLALPYLEYVAPGGTTRSGFAVNLTTRNLTTYTLDATSLKSQTAFSNAVNAPQISMNGTQFLLTIPYLSFSSGGTEHAYAVALTSTDLLTYSLSMTSLKELTVLGAPSAVAVANITPRTAGTTAFSSSTKLTAAWTAPAGYTPNHYRIYASETVGNTNLDFTALATDTSATLPGLKSATTYAVVVKACKDAACIQAGTSAAVTGKTSEEVWQFQGTGSTTAGLTKTVSDGNALFSATRFGPEAGGSTASRIQLYYKSLTSRGPSIAVSSAATDAAVPSSYLSFTSFGTTYGLLTPATAATLVSEAGGVHAVPLRSGAVRLFFDPLGSDSKSRIMYLDSQDGLVGRDFNSGAATNCSSAADYSVGGGCSPTVIIGVAGDSVRANSKIPMARQFKVGFPTLDDWRWDQAPGTFMVFTTDSIAGCTTYGLNHAYAIWDGTNWVVQYESNGCPKLFKSAQAAFPMHAGGVRYKLYYGDPSVTTGRVTTTMIPFLGPKKLIYADGATSGSPTTVDFEDWESQTQARNVVFLWPSGDQLDATAEGYIDDYHFIAPTGSADLQVLYCAISNGTDVPFGAAAVLLNP